MKEILHSLLRWLLRLYYYRVPLITGMITVGLPLLVFTRVGAMVRGVFDIDTWPSLFLSGLMSMLLMWGMRLPGRLIRIYGPERFDFVAKGLLKAAGKQPVADNSPWRDFGWFLIGLVPMLAIFIGRLDETGFLLGKDETGIPAWSAGLTILLGGICGTVIYIGAMWLAGVGWDSDHDHILPLPWLGQNLSDKLKGVMSRRHDEVVAKVSSHDGPPVLDAFWRWVCNILAKLPPQLRPGIINSAGEPRSGHLAALAYWILSTVVLAIVGVMNPASVAPLVSLLALLLAGCTLLSGVAFFLDRIPLPLSVVVGFWVIVVSGFWRKDHEIVRQVTDKGTPEPASVILRVDDVKDGGDNFPIVIAAEGGGIHAGLWTTHVIEEILRECSRAGIDNGPREFIKRIRCVSGVSGGSYGMMYFINARTGGGIEIGPYAAESPPGEEPFEGVPKWKPLSEAAGRSGLGAVVHGLVFRDILNATLPVSRSHGRGDCLEAAWLEAAPTLKGVTMSDWLEATRKKSQGCPAVLFNATSVEQGVPIVFGTSCFDETAGKSVNWCYEKSGNYTIPVVSAVRASSTFPYVTPAVLVTNGSRREHAVDGGYFDNYGMAVMMQWLHGGLEKLARENPDQCPRSVLVIQIRSGGKVVENANTWDIDPKINPSMEPPAQSADFTASIGAPLTTMMSVRTAGQRQHADDDFNRLGELWKTRRVDRKEPGDKEIGCNVILSNAVFTFRGGDPPLSWHLTEKEKRDVLEVRLSRKCPQALKVVLDYIRAAKGESGKVETPEPSLAPRPVFPTQVRNYVPTPLTPLAPTQAFQVPADTKAASDQREEWSEKEKFRQPSHGEASKTD